MLHLRHKTHGNHNFVFLCVFNIHFVLILYVNSLTITIKGILEILDLEYGVNRDKYTDDGGYAVVAERIEDFKEIQRL